MDRTVPAALPRGFGRVSIGLRWMEEAASGDAKSIKIIPAQNMSRSHTMENFS